MSSDSDTEEFNRFLISISSENEIVTECDNSKRKEFEPTINNPDSSSSDEANKRVLLLMHLDILLLILRPNLINLLNFFSQIMEKNLLKFIGCVLHWVPSHGFLIHILWHKMVGLRESIDMRLRQALHF